MANKIRTRCEIYSRIVGYLRPLDQWNEGKREEFKDRVTFKIEPLKKQTMIITPPSRNNPCDFSSLISPEPAGKEISEIDMRLWGNLVYAKALSLSRKVNDELLLPMSKWIDDPDWMERFKIFEDRIPNWAEYKRRQRKWTRIRKQLLKERIKLYWQEIRRKRRFRKEINRIRDTPSLRASPEVKVDQDYLAPIVSPFSPIEQLRQETMRLFQQARTLSIPDLLPWRILIATELTETKPFNDLKEYCAKNKDKASKLIHLLCLETDGMVKLNQDKPFGEIKIEPIVINQEQSIKITDQQGSTYNFNWQDLSDAQRDKVIADIKERKILCKAI